jgi:hypothetical protein
VKDFVELLGTSEELATGISILVTVAGAVDLVGVAEGDGVGVCDAEGVGVGIVAKRHQPGKCGECVEELFVQGG